jgi:hypothetical protein
LHASSRGVRRACPCCTVPTMLRAGSPKGKGPRRSMCMAPYTEPQATRSAAVGTTLQHNTAASHAIEAVAARLPTRPGPSTASTTRGRLPLPSARVPSAIRSYSPGCCSGCVSSRVLVVGEGGAFRSGGGGQRGTRECAASPRHATFAGGFGARRGVGEAARHGTAARRRRQASAGKGGTCNTQAPPPPPSPTSSRQSSRERF